MEPPYDQMVTPEIADGDVVVNQWQRTPPPQKRTSFQMKSLNESSIGLLSFQSRFLAAFSSVLLRLITYEISSEAY